VLIVDDFSSNLRVAKGLLAPYGARVSTCRNGREALELVRQRPFDLILMDHMMSEMDGVEVTRAIRAMSPEYCRTRPVVALTANAVSGMREMFLENGFTDFLAKPIDLIKLDTVLKKWIPAEKRRSLTEGDRKDPESAGRPETAFPKIEGVDAAAGIARIGGSPDRYLDLLETFRRDAEAGFASLEREPDEASLRSFITLVHALKSALGNIGAAGLSRSAALLEKAGCSADMPVIRDMLPFFREELAALMARIREISESAYAGSGDDGKQPAAVEEILTCLRTALEAGEATAADAALARLQALPLAGKMRGAVSGIEDSFLMMDFQKAADAVTALLKQK
jgi:CheY-like chemotaxis protein